MLKVLVAIVLLTGVGLTMIGLPGNLLIFFTALAYGYGEDFIHVTPQLLLILLAALLAGEAVEFLAGMLGAKKAKAAKRTLLAAPVGAVTGGMLGTTVVPVIGSILGAVGGAFLASFIAEYSKENNPKKAWQVAKSVMVGQMIGIISKTAVAVGMAVLILSRLWG